MLTGHYLYECLKKYSRFQLIHMTARRVAELQSGARPLVDTKFASATEVALQEIAEGKLYAASRRPEAIEERENMEEDLLEEDEE